MAEEKNFRINAKKFFLTYPQCDLTPNDLLSFAKTKGLLTRYYIGREKHEDGGLHLHAALDYANKLNIKDPKAFDYKQHHPNIQSVKNWSSVVAYCIKDGDFITATELDYSDPTNFRKRKADFDAWQQHLDDKQLKDVTWPIKLPDEKEFDPRQLGKKRHLWIVGAPDIGKTTWIQNEFAGKKVYLRGTNKYPFDDYNGESVIIYDDIQPTFAEIASVSVTYKIKTKVFGDTRFKCVYYPLNIDLVMIVISNFPPNFGVHDQAVNARFNVVYL